MSQIRKCVICLLIGALCSVATWFFKMQTYRGLRIVSNLDVSKKESLDLEDTQAARLQRVKEWCRKHANEKKVPWEGVNSCMVNTDRKVIYCPINKVASTSWKLAMVLSTDELKEMNVSYSRVKAGGGKKRDADLTVRVHSGGISKFGLKYMKHYPLEDRPELFKDYFKFIFVREPMDRLYSGYQDKIKSDLDEQYKPYKGAYLRNIGTKIIKMFRPDSPEHVLKSGRSVTFEEFLAFMNEKMNNGSDVNTHWRPFHRILDPCAFEFDFIGKHETFGNDLKFVLPKLFSSDMTESVFPKHNVKTTDKHISVLDRVQDRSIFAKIVRHYAKDFEVYGYDMKKYL